ncbi:sortase [Bacillus cereus BAG1X1-2]|uniref:Class D sortase n=1 Tax=Bacillus thuringiensis TaxID=1428 RepID=A0AB36V8J0_BACTU|nr:MULTISPECIES: class D sortase [Bacillus cereus group]EJS45036.1 sortase [Bacillus cereus BAG1X1-2]PFI27330.1 class D sortase [Bacillus thuringiensis]PFP73375.1 class D sortase [Bacillus thuringiensis]PGZ02287.1 class D sortase [Bacillus thuringiensis]
MKKLEWFGVLLITMGSISLAYYFIEWYDSRKTTEALTNEEVQYYQNIEMSNKDKQTLPITSQQTPSSQIQHQDGKRIAYMVIPKIKRKYSIYWGADDKTLKKGVGMLVSDNTTTPSGNGHTVLSGHRDTVFTDLGELKENDYILVEYDNKVYVYQINKHWITDADDLTVIVPKATSTLTLTTCYPFKYIGDAPERYIIESSLVSVL